MLSRVPPCSIAVSRLRDLRQNVLNGLPSSLEYNANLVISKASYSYDQHKMWHSTCKIAVRVTACVSIDCVCGEEPPLYLRFKEEEILHNLAKVISW